MITMNTIASTSTKSKIVTFLALIMLANVSYGAGCLTSLTTSTDGRLLANQCAQCHGTDGRSKSSLPSLAGRPESDLYGDLIDRKYRPIEGIMDRQARGYTDEQLCSIAKYLSGIAP
jgi:cytochrome c553